MLPEQLLVLLVQLVCRAVAAFGLQEKHLRLRRIPGRCWALLSPSLLTHACSAGNQERLSQKRRRIFRILFECVHLCPLVFGHVRILGTA